MVRFARGAAIGAAIVLTLLGSACARPVGDFGRAEPDPMHDKIMPAIGNARASASGEPVSAFNLSDQEQEMRDRIWRYLVSPHAYDWFGDTLVELRRTRITPSEGRAFKTDRYYRWLHKEEFASSRVRYSRIGADVKADIDQMPSTFRSICAVIEVDRERGVAAAGVAGLEPKMIEDAEARRAENQTTIAWFVGAASNRYESYSYALNHLLVETPHEEAVGVDGLLSQLAIYVDAAEAGDFCGELGGAGKGQSGVAIRSRFLHSAPSEGPYRK